MHDQAGLFKAIAHVLENLFPDVVFLQKMTELQQGCCIRNLFIDEVDFEKTPHGITVIDSFFHSFIGEIEPVLHEVHAKHNLDVDRFTTALIVVIVRLDNPDPMTPGKNLIHGVQELFPFGFPPAV